MLAMLLLLGVCRGEALVCACVWIEWIEWVAWVESVWVCGERERERERDPGMDGPGTLLCRDDHLPCGLGRCLYNPRYLWPCGPVALGPCSCSCSCRLASALLSNPHTKLAQPQVSGASHPQVFQMFCVVRFLHGFCPQSLSMLAFTSLAAFQHLWPSDA